MVTVSLEFGGGLELLFGNAKRLPAVCIPAPPGGGGGVRMRDALRWLREHMLRERPELFMAGDSVRPGILVLVNDADWELEGRLEYELQEGDALAFISTLHGG